MSDSRVPVCDLKEGDEDSGRAKPELGLRLRPRLIEKLRPSLALRSIKTYERCKIYILVFLCEFSLILRFIR